MNSEIKELYRLGFAIHLLHPKSKRPVDTGWTTGPRKKWKTLRLESKKGQNVGVRLGSASMVGTHYLNLIDCDVKSNDPRHLKELNQKLAQILGKRGDLCPQVLSGRGNGSKHFYFLSKEPAKPRRLTQSSETVRVLMPSAERASKRDLTALNPKLIKAGYRLRPAWEISLMGDGQQVVLPPSIHPDSGQPYKWNGRRPQTFDDFPVINLTFKDDQTGTKESAAKSGAALKDWKPVPVDLIGSKLSDKIVDKIVSGEGVSDRSSALLGVSNAMLKAGFTDDEVLTVLTDPDNHLGECAYDHAKTKSRAKAAEWVRKYTLDKSKAETLAEEVFNDNVEIEDTPRLSLEQVEKEKAKLLSERDWFDDLERGPPQAGSPVKNTLKNVILILRGEAGEKIFKRDEFANADFYDDSAPWGSKLNAEVVDQDTIRIKTWLAEKYKFEPSNDRINEAISSIADTNRFHPVKDYLNALPEWDGVPRIDTWLKDYIRGEASEPYLSAVSRKVLVAMIARIFEPGCKFDHVLILEGKQGKGKSTAVSILADPWFSDTVLNINDKDSVVNMRSMWILEMGELSSMRQVDLESWKAFASRRVDRIRMPYGRRAENFPRQCIFVGTTNDQEYLRDPTGNRRFWPVKVGQCRFKALRAVKDQLFAEALFAYEMGEKLWLDDKAAEDAAKAEQSERTFVDPWVDDIKAFLAEKEDDLKDGFRSEILFKDFGPLESVKPDRSNQMKASRILKSLGFKNTKFRLNGGRPYHYWKKPFVPS